MVDVEFLVKSLETFMVLVNDCNVMTRGVED